VHTIYDWSTMAIFAGLVVLFLQRSMSHEEPQDHILQYLPPALGCACANYVGNHGSAIIAWVLIVAVLGYIVYILKPFKWKV